MHEENLWSFRKWNKHLKLSRAKEGKQICPNKKAKRRSDEKRLKWRWTICWNKWTIDIFRWNMTQTREVYSSKNQGEEGRIGVRAVIWLSSWMYWSNSLCIKAVYRAEIWRSRNPLLFKTIIMKHRLFIKTSDSRW